MALLPLFWDELSELWDAQGINQKEFSSRLKKAFPRLKLGKSEPALSRKCKESGREPIPDEVARWALAQKAEPGYEEDWAAYLRKREAASTPAAEPITPVSGETTPAVESVPAVPSVAEGGAESTPAVVSVPPAGAGTDERISEIAEAVPPGPAQPYAASVHAENPESSAMPAGSPSQSEPGTVAPTGSRSRWLRIVAAASVLAFAVGAFAGVLMAWHFEQRTCQQTAENERECLNALRQALQLATTFRQPEIGATVMGGLPMPDKPEPDWLRCPNDCGRFHKPPCKRDGKVLRGVVGVRGTCWNVGANPSWLTVPPTYEKCPPDHYDPPPEAPEGDKGRCFDPVKVSFTPSVVP